MPGGFPLGLEICGGTSVGADLTNMGTAITAGASHAAGAWVQLIASTAADTCWLEVSIYGTQNSSTVVAVDIGVGAAASEVVVASKLITPNQNTNRNLVGHYLFPCSIPAGARVAARCYGNNAADASNVSIILYDGAFTSIEGAAGVDALSFNAAVRGTTVTGTTASSKGSYAQMIASTARDYIGLIATVDTGSVNDWALMDIAIGAGGSEKIIIPNLGINYAGASAPSPGTFGPWFIPIPSGTRLAARMDCYSTGSATVNLSLYGIYQ